MNWIDLAVLAVWCALAFWGASMGFLRMIVHFAVVVFALAFSSRLAPGVGDLLVPVTDNENLQTVGAFIIIFVVLFIAGGIVTFWAGLILGRIPFFGLPNRLAGMVVGVLVGFLLLSGIFTAIQRFPVGSIDEAIDDSKLGSFLTDNFDVVIRAVGLIPGEWDGKLEKISQ